MPRWRTYGDQDVVPEMNGDRGWRGLDRQRTPAGLESGVYSLGRNVRCEDGTVRTRKGHLGVPWGAPGEPRSVLPVDWGEGQWLLAAGREQAFLTRPGYVGTTVGYPSSDILWSWAAELVQAQQYIFLLRGADHAPWRWTGGEAGGFVQAPSASGVELKPFPRGSVGVYFKDRLWVAHDRDLLSWSNIAAFDTWQAANFIRVSDGDEDDILALVPWRRDHLLIFKSRSIWVMENVGGDPKGDQARLSLITPAVGLAAHHAWADVGGDVVFLSPSGVRSVAQVLDDKTVVAQRAISHPVQPIVQSAFRLGADLMEKPEWRRRVWMETHGSRLYLNYFVLNSANAVEDRVLVYNFENEAWESEDTLPNPHLAGQAPEGDIPMLYGMVRLQDGVGENLYLVTPGILLHAEATNECTDIHVAEPRLAAAVPWEWHSRAYAGQNFDEVIFASGTLHLSTWGQPTATVVVHPDGPFEQKEVLTLTRDRTKSLWWGRYPTDPTNADGRATEPGREDYSIPNDLVWQPPPEGYAEEMEQEVREPIRIRVRGRAARLGLSGPGGGMVRLHSVQIVMTGALYQEMQRG